jgi:hypothetical protein
MRAWPSGGIAACGHHVKRDHVALDDCILHGIAHAELDAEAELLQEEREAPSDIAHGKDRAEGLKSRRHGARHFRGSRLATPA